MEYNRIPRPIRSFVRRTGRITDAQQRNLDTLWEHYGREPGSTILDLNTVFGRHAPVWLEIGFGNGDFLAKLAFTHPEVNMLGIEVHRPGIGKLLGQLQNLGINNTRLFNADVVELLPCLPAAILERVYILFPDPWPKLRHHKRRLIQHHFVTLLTTKCVKGGQVFLATDCEDYAVQMMNVFSQISEWHNPFGNGQFSPRPPERLATRFETRGLRLGYKVWDLTFLLQTPSMMSDIN